jgi:hypothetical protein
VLIISNEVFNAAVMLLWRFLLWGILLMATFFSWAHFGCTHDADTAQASLQGLIWDIVVRLRDCTSAMANPLSMKITF